MGVGHQTQPKASRVELLERWNHVVIEREMATGRPFLVHLPGARIQAGSLSTHLLHEPSDVADEQLRTIGRIVSHLEFSGSGSDGRREPCGIDGQAMLATKRLVPCGIEPRPGIDKREIDVEEHRLHGGSS